MNFGFSYVGAIYLCMLFVPNIIWSKFKPQGYDENAKKENKVLQIFERVGEITVTTFCLIFSDFNFNGVNLWSLWLLLSFLCMVLYEIYWIRYFMSERTMEDMYSPLLGVPVAGATLPVVAFLLLAVYGKNLFLMVAVVLLGIGHIGIHLQHKLNLKYDHK